MKGKILFHYLEKAYNEKKRLIAPLLGFPALKLINSTIKLAQQNYYEHYKALKSIAETFQPDAIFPLMDLSVEANALGRYTLFPVDDSATVVTEEITNDELEKMKEIDIRYDSRLLGYVETIKLMRINFSNKILIGAYVTGPYTLAGLLLGASNAATLSITNPDYLKQVCEIVTEKILNYVKLLINAGAQIICVLEPSAVMLGPEQFNLFSKNYVNKICNLCIDTEISVVYHICGNSMHLIDKMCESGVDALSLDSKEAGVDLVAVAKKVPENIIIIGNICPTGNILIGKPEDVCNEVNNLLIQMNPYKNFILSTGCDLPKEVPVENIKAFIEAGRNFKIEY
ncbi:uroporphyrinogen decarboxylase family protein [Rosettibacter firmus]|uniref:uroporphyrinogen decarboxylase family protein n=1 Tax=Rosettibacter firmus TaxID=3111522 RepID=UPI00336BC6DD